MADDAKPLFYIKYLSQDTLPDWNKVAGLSDEIWAFHDIALSDFWAKRKNAEKRSFIVYNVDTQPIAICPLYFYSDDWNRFILRNKRTLESFYLSGPAIKNGLNEKTRRKLIHYIGNTIREIGDSLKIDVGQIGTSTLSKRNTETHYAYVNPLLEMRGDWESIETTFLYLSLASPEDELLKRMETRTRSIITKIEKEQKIKTRAATPYDLDAIWNVYVDIYKRTGLPFFPKDEMEWLLSYKNSNFYVAEIDNVIVSAINMLTYGSGGLYFSSYTAAAFVDTEVATYLLWHTLKEEKKKGVIHIDLGHRPFGSLGEKKDNIARFLRGYGGELRYRYRMQYVKPGYGIKFLRLWDYKITPPLALLRVKILSKTKKILGKR